MSDVADDVAKALDELLMADDNQAFIEDCQECGVGQTPEWRALMERMRAWRMATDRI